MSGRGESVASRPPLLTLTHNKYVIEVTRAAIRLYVERLLMIDAVQFYIARGRGERRLEVASGRVSSTRLACALDGVTN